MMDEKILSESTPTVFVVGGGAAGMMAAYMAALSGASVTLFESNPMLGKKLRITGKGRCNVTNNCTPAEFLEAVTRNRKFLYGAAAGFTPADTMQFFENLGVPLKTERGRRVFPVSDKAADIVHALEKAVVSAGITVRKGTRVADIRPESETDTPAVKVGGDWLPCHAVILATGGVSYPGTGSTGDGHRILRAHGVPVTQLKPSLVPIETAENTGDLMGLTLKNVTLTAKRGGKTVYTELGEMLFAHFGLTGPLVLSASANMQEGDISEYSLFIDLKPALSFEELDRRLIGDFTKYSQRDFCNALDDLLPKKLIPWCIAESKIPPHTKTASVNKVMRQNFAGLLKALPFTPTAFRPIAEAIITCGGVETKAVQPKTMMLKDLPGIFAVGELLDLDAYTGGYNLQIAFSTGYLAGQGAAAYAFTKTDA